MVRDEMPKEEAIARGKKIYNEKLRARLEREAMGKFVAVDVYSEDFEVGEDDADVCLRLLARRPDALIYGNRVGQETAYRFGLGKIRPQS